MYGYIYETTCLIDGKKYIGMHKWDKTTIDPSYLGSGIHLRRAIDKYGKDNFSCRIIEWCETREQLSEREKYHISINKAPISDDYYNIEDGGFGGHSEYYHQELTDNQLKSLEYGRHLPASDLLKSKLSEYRRNVVVTDETRNKLRKLQLGKKCINNSCINKYVRTDELQEYLNNGWTLGKAPMDYSYRTEKFKQTHSSKDNTQWKNNISQSIKGRRWVNNGVEQRQIKPDELQNYLDNGYVLGRFKLTKRFND